MFIDKDLIFSKFLILKNVEKKFTTMGTYFINIDINLVF